MNVSLLLGAEAAHGQTASSALPEISIFPHRVWVGGLEVSSSVVVGWGTTLVLLVLLVLGYLRTRSFQEQPRGAQKWMELIVDSVYSFARGKVGHIADFVGPAVLALMSYIALGTLVELFGIPPMTEDFSCTFALGLVAFVTVNVTALHERGLKGRLKNLATPSPVVFPIRVLTDVLAPFSMGLRLFANVLVGGIIMKLIYAVLPILVPVPVAAYFNVVHVCIQVYVFGMLTLSYVSEAVE